MKVERFEDLIAWQKARELTRSIYKLTSNKLFLKDHGLREQIQRASVSIMSNVAEGFERDSRAQFHHFLTIAKGSCAEVRSKLYVALDIGYISDIQFADVSERAEEVSRIVGGLKASVNKRTD